MVQNFRGSLWAVTGSRVDWGSNRYSPELHEHVGDRRHGACNPDRVSLMRAESIKVAMESLAGDLSSREVEVSEDTEPTDGKEESHCPTPSQSHCLV